jgi:hypothetical protein
MQVPGSYGMAYRLGGIARSGATVQGGRTRAMDAPIEARGDQKWRAREGTYVNGGYDGALVSQHDRVPPPA